MRIRLNFFILFAFCACGFAPASAAENLDFDAHPSERNRALIDHFIKGDDPVAIAETDLNEDGIDEFILKDSTCNPANFCNFTIVADGGDTLIELGKIKALNLMLGNGYSSGIRNILAFQNNINDFDHELYVWEPAQARYILSKQENNQEQR